jgi:hypothetical protein
MDRASGRQQCRRYEPAQRVENEGSPLAASVLLSLLKDMSIEQLTSTKPIGAPGRRVSRYNVDFNDDFNGDFNGDFNDDFNGDFNGDYNGDYNAKSIEPAAVTPMP